MKFICAVKGCENEITGMDQICSEHWQKLSLGRQKALTEARKQSILAEKLALMAALQELSSGS